MNVVYSANPSLRSIHTDLLHKKTIVVQNKSNLLLKIFLKTFKDCNY